LMNGKVSLVVGLKEIVKFSKRQVFPNDIRQIYQIE